MKKITLIILVSVLVHTPALAMDAYLYQAARQGDPQAQNNLGWMYFYGRKGANQSDRDAAYWFYQAASQGHAQAQNNLGALYEMGRGVPQNFVEAIRFYCLAAQQGFPNAITNLRNLNAHCDVNANTRVLPDSTFSRENLNQDTLPDQYELIDRHALNVPTQAERSINSLAMYLKQPTRNDYEKARAIYRWVTNNIAYDAASYFTGDCRDDSPEKVLWTRKAVCSGYANLFLALGQAIGINVEKVIGTARVNDFAGSHAWNVVTINGQRYWVDSTWGAGYVDTQTKSFIPYFNEAYFLVAPHRLAQTHTLN